MTIRRLASVVLVASFMVSIPGTASAAWLATGADNGKARADTMPDGPMPTVSVSGRSVQVSWSARSFTDGTNVAGYVVTRYDPSDAATPATGACAGTITALTCTEAATPPGTWRFAVRTVQGGWTGVEGAKSGSAVVAAPSFTRTSSATVTSLPSVVTGDLAGYVGGETVTFRLDDASSGTVLSGSTTPSTIPTDGQASASVTLPNGVADGSHAIYAVGSSGTTTNVTVTVDRTAPTVSAATIAKAAGGIDGAIGQGGTYYVYANVSDGVTGVASVTADVSSLTTGATAVTLVAGSYTVDGVTYGYRSAVLTANVTLPAGATPYTVRASDAAGNTTSPTFSVTVDNTVPTGVDVQAVNGGATVGRPEAGDVITLTYSESMEPDSLISGWNGAATSVTVRIIQASGSDQLQIWSAADTGQLASFGSIRLADTAYVTSTVSFTTSTAVLAGSTVTITLGTPNGATGTASGTPRMRWTTAVGATDVAGNACTAANANEGGGNDLDF